MYEIKSLEKQREAIWIPMGPSDRSASLVTVAGKDNDPTATALMNYDYYDELLRLKVEDLKKKLMFLEDILSMLAGEKERTVLRYYFAQGKKDAEIAEVLDVDEKTVANRRRNGVKRLERSF